METTTNRPMIMKAENAATRTNPLRRLGIDASSDLSFNYMTCFTSPTIIFKTFFIIHYFMGLLQGFAVLFHIR